MLRKLVRNGCKRDEQFRNVMTNHEILQRCKTSDIQSFVLKQQTSYLGHLARQPNTSLTKRLLFNDNKRNKRTKQGRPMESLEDKVIKKLNVTKDQFYKDALKKKGGHDHTSIDRRQSSQ